MKGESSRSTLTPLQMWRPEEIKDSHHGMEMAIVPSSTAAISPTSRFAVPDHWLVEDRRRTSGKTAGVVDRYYYEPETGLKFRSVKSIERYLSEEHIPLKMLGLDKKEKLLHKRKLGIVPRSTTTRNSSFKLPDGWVVEECLRTSGYSAGRVDRYYYDPDTGMKFRSKISVERYLAESEENTPILKMLGFDKKEELLHKRKMVVAARATTTRTSSLKLPEGWVVEECVRTSGNSAGMVDKYYIEPKTGRKFRSLISAERHLAEVNGSLPTPKESKPDNRMVLLSADRQGLHQNRDMAIVAHASSTYGNSIFQLPVDQNVKEISSSSPNYDDLIDELMTVGVLGENSNATIVPEAKLERFDLMVQFYYEQGTGRQFRSIRDVERCLNEGSENIPTPRALKSGNYVTRTQNSGSRKRKVSDFKEKTSSFNSTKPPVKVKWVLTGPGGDTWSPFVGESMVPDSVKQQWASTFILSVDYRNFDA